MQLIKIFIRWWFIKIITRVCVVIQRTDMALTFVSFPLFVKKKKKNKSLNENQSMNELQQLVFTKLNIKTKNSNVFRFL